MMSPSAVADRITTASGGCSDAGNPTGEARPPGADRAAMESYTEVVTVYHER